jgi:hypothetical protein
MTGGAIGMVVQVLTERRQHPPAEMDENMKGDDKSDKIHGISPWLRTFPATTEQESD